jgi:signal transduction histidine kinase/CheY-like chemotaxis protein
LDRETPETALDTSKLPDSVGSRQWALVESNGRFLGLLNSWQLLKFLAPLPQTEDVETLHATSLGQNPQHSPMDEQRRETTTIHDRQFSLTKLSLPPCLFPEWTTEAWKDALCVPTQPDAAKPTIPEKPLNSPNSPLWLVMAQDTTDQQQVAQELAAKNADLVQLNRLKDEFLACISHELKTPLTAVLGLSTLLKDQSLGELNQRQARYARLIYQNGRQLMAVVNDILDLTRMETGQLELTLEPVQIQSACDRAYQQALQVYSDNNPNQEGEIPDISFVLDIEPGLDTIIADELRLRQMLAHLLSNALKFTETENTIGLKVNHQDGWIAFKIWDTGIGIPEDKQHLIFQKFQQLEEPLTRQFEGTGLGLVLTQRLARLHGGDISFISKSGDGSEFTLLLPPCPPSGKDLAETQDWEQVSTNLSSPHRNRLVLIVETVPRYLESLTAQLKQLGYWVVNARSGPEALAKARSLQPSIILLNPLLPQVSGWDVLKLLKSDSQTCHIPIVVTATQAEKQQADQNNADGFLRLPVQADALAKSLTRLGKHQPPTNQVLTLLYVSAGLVEVPPESSRLISQLTDILSCQHSDLKYRVLEADDLEQAELLARVWNPDIVLLDGAGITDHPSYFKAYSANPALAELPLITLDHQTTQAANQAIGLSVYPCLAPDNPQKITTLLQVIQIAAGVSRKSSILIFDLGNNQTASPKHPTFNPHPVTPYTPWLRALIQYLQAAGFRSLFSHCWSDVYHQLEAQMVDVLLIRIKDMENDSGVVQELNKLNQLPNRPPILLLDHRLPDSSFNVGVSEFDKRTTELESQLQSVATKVLPGRSYSMSQLLEQIHQVLG